MSKNTSFKMRIKNNLRPVKKLLDPIVGKIDEYIVRIAVKNIFLSNLYYLFQFKFGWEHRAVLAGKKIYKQSLKNPIYNTSLLRRNTHRLEKGLLMRPRRVPFGLDYISETVHAYKCAVEAKTERNELTWAKHVIEEYMRITPNHPKIDPLRKIVENLSNQSIEEADTAKKKIPYIRLTEDKPDISYEDLLKLAKYRRSVRWFLPDQVDRSIVTNAIQVAAYSPTACNRQPYEFRIFDNPELVSQVIRLPMGTSGFSHQVPNVAVVVGKLRNYFNERDRHLIYIDGSLAIMSFINALEVQGVGSCCINWPDVPKLEKKMAKLLNLEKDERPIMLVAFGYPDPEGMVANSTKKPENQLIKYNFEENAS
ncbi:nitroreductase family protein [Acinetobacter towneri]|uniref:nitroreductase family protein n=1 Tax=Acinetobacter towneri TaxID=202956 RepID=UPI001CE17B95|nr:nitroreductase family protein [Acinetobacter towneri]MCA4797970.1 nitroreductase family protein [Acinetobacter towneri]